jgi:hypothetical protein
MANKPTKAEQRAEKRDTMRRLLCNMAVPYYHVSETSKQVLQTVRFVSRDLIEQHAKDTGETTPLIAGPQDVADLLEAVLDEIRELCQYEIDNGRPKRVPRRRTTPKTPEQ